jgi:hypothetical protein
MLPMLSSGEQKKLWEEWLSAEIRAHYFADLCSGYLRWQKWINWATLLLSSGAVAVLVADSTIPGLILMLATAGLSLWSLVAQNQKLATDCSDLHFRWNTLGTEYAELWERMYELDAPTQLRALNRKGGELSKSGTTFPNRPKLMEKWQDHVVRLHVAA